MTAFGFVHFRFGPWVYVLRSGMVIRGRDGSRPVVFMRKRTNTTRTCTGWMKRMRTIEYRAVSVMHPARILKTFLKMGR